MQLNKPDKHFGEVNVYKLPSGALDIVATILITPNVEGARTGLALDASNSMKDVYAIGTNPLFGGQPNQVEPVARTMAQHLCMFSGTGKCHVSYWAVGPGGYGVEVIGDFDQDSAPTMLCSGPRVLGTGTKLLPPVKYFVENVFQGSPWSLCLILTDGVIEDLQDVQTYCLELGKKIADGSQPFVKFVLIGLGKGVDEGQMEALDDMFEGSGLVDQNGDDVDIWDHILAENMRTLDEIFKEVVSRNTRVADYGRVLDSSGGLVATYSDGVPAIMRFQLPVGATGFRLVLPGGEIVQDVSEVL